MLRLLLLASLALCHFGPVSAQGGDPLADWGLHATTGAAAGYVTDSACAECHADKAESYAEMGMARSFYRATGAKPIEDFTALPFFHAPSQRYYEMWREGETLQFRRYRLAPDGTRIDVFERQVDWVLGSGNHVRTYLYQAPDGALFEFPLAWYSQAGKWEMNPGYEGADHMGVQRQVRRRCMACHNAYPEVPAGSDRDGWPDLFPADLPQGLGCQRCHGPGAAHTRSAISGEQNTDLLKALIVNPGKLAPDRLYSICYGCHMQPTVAVNAPLRSGRGIYSFRPGEKIGDYLTHIDIEDGGRTRPERFEINHHPYRLEQSACFTESRGRLGCLDCHDPHVKIKPVERASHYRKACLQCHALDPAGQPEMATGTHPAIETEADCTICHMPERRTQDVIHATMTDHRITRDPGDLATLTAPMPKVTADVRGVSLLRPGEVSGDEATIQNVLAIFSNTARRADYASEALARVLNATNWQHPEPWLELALSHLAQHDFPAGEVAARAVLVRAPDNPQAREVLALALFHQGREEDGLAQLAALLADHPDLARARFNQAALLAARGDTEAALSAARQVLDLRPAHWLAHRLIAGLEAARGNEAAAIEAYLAALAAEPRATDVREPLIELLKKTGRPTKAARHQVPAPQPD